MNIYKKINLSGESFQEEFLENDLEGAVNEMSKDEVLRNVMEYLIGPLTSIVALNQAIMSNRYGKANSNIQGASRIATENGRHLVHLVEEMIELISMGMTNLELRPDPVQLYPFISELHNKILSEASNRGIHVGLNYRLDRTLEIHLDTEKFQIIFLKLVEKAVCCSRKNSQVIISLEQSPKSGFIDLIIEDSSKGLDQEELQHIFDGQFLKEKDRKTSQYGIVPALVKKYAMLFGADLSVFSQKGRGTTFIFSFPQILSSELSIIDPKEKNTSLPTQSKQLTDLIYYSPTPSTQPHTAKRHRSLLISNQEANLQALSGYLEADYNLLFGRDREETMELLKKYQSKIDFIVCGGDLLFQNHFELLNTIKSHHRWKRFPIVVISDEIKASVKIRSLVMGVDTYMVAPFQKEELMCQIQDVLALYRERDEWRVAAKKCASAQDVKVTDADLFWLTELENIIQKEMANRHFNLAELAYQMATSERQLFRKVKELTGRTPNKYLRDLRMYAAKKLLENYSYQTVAEVSYAVGFQDPHYFSKIYKGQFGVWPSEYL
ncbi:MAG: helix-turn-helix domain-containing protein [Bacteroidota bacterium]